MVTAPARLSKHNRGLPARIWAVFAARSAREYLLAATLIVIVIAVSFGSHGNFWQQSNLTNFFISSAIIAIPAVGMTMVILTGGIDVSVGSMFGLVAAAGGWVCEQGFGMPVALPVFIAAGALLGLINGAIITYARVPPIIATLGTLSIFRAAVFLLLGNHWITDIPASFTMIFMIDKLWVLPLGAVLALVVMAIFALFLSRWPAGRHIYAIGNNEEAARLAGINVRRLKLLTYVATGVLVGLAVPVGLGHSPMVQTSTGTGFVLTVIAAVVLGGTELTGGRGTMLGTLLGTLLVGLVDDGVVLLHIQPFWSGVILGAIIVVSVAFAQRRGDAEAVR
jgi:ribose/xylose/arabinose/galactoside ABC-type transport system permease subunit